MLGQLPRFALVTPQFRFRALVAFAGRSPIGGDREVALACLVVARVAAGTAPPYQIPATDSVVRATAARQWLASLTLPTHVRSAAADVLSAIESGAAPLALAALVDVASAHLDEASIAELRAAAAENEAAARASRGAIS